MTQRFTDKQEDDPLPRRGHKAASDPVPKAGRPLGGASCACGGSCPRCQAAQADSANRAPSTAEGAHSNPGTPLDSATRQPLERFFQRDLNDIRLFSDDASRTTAQSLGALAYTYGQDIHLGSQAQALSGERRNALLAHEVTHALQQPVASGEPGHDAAVDAANAPGEHHADAMSRAFMADRQGRPEGTAMRDRLGSHQVASPRLQLTRFPTHYGEFEDYKFNEVKDAAGTVIGVQMYLKFHPGPNVDATKIGITQAAGGHEDGKLTTEGVWGRRQATSGPGAGNFIDAGETNPSPMYGATSVKTTGAPADKLGSYGAPGISAVTHEQLVKAGFDVTGIGYGGGSVFGYNYLDAGVQKGPVPAEMHDAPMMPSAMNSSEQHFESAALAMEGKMAGTYLGAVQWGWSRDAAGKFSSIPASIKSRGVPSSTFLTAASVWNPAKEGYGLLASLTPTPILKPDLSAGFNVLKGTVLREIGSATHGGVDYLAVAIVDGTGRTGVIVKSDAAMGDFGRDTVDLPIPEIHTIKAGGTLLDGEFACSPNDPVLPAGTRLSVLGQYSSLPQYVRVMVADGPLTGRRGVVRRDLLTREVLGTRP